LTTQVVRRFGGAVQIMRVAVLGLLLGLVCDARAQQCDSDFVGDREMGAQIAARQCAACHGSAGIAVTTQIPNLAGQLPEYLAKQLEAFRASPGGKALRPSPVMSPLVAALSKSDVTALAAYYSTLSPPTNTARDLARLELGRTIYTKGNPEEGLPACITCHRPTGSGIRPDFPRLAGQSADYVENQLSAWMAVRGKPGKLMTMIVPHLQPAERQAVADYVAHLH
jgi:cytochrome c553